MDALQYEYDCEFSMSMKVWKSSHKLGKWTALWCVDICDFSKMMKSSMSFHKICKRMGALQCESACESSNPKGNRIPYHIHCRNIGSFLCESGRSSLIRSCDMYWRNNRCICTFYHWKLDGASPCVSSMQPLCWRRESMWCRKTSRWDSLVFLRRWFTEKKNKKKSVLRNRDIGNNLIVWLWGQCFMYEVTCWAEFVWQKLSTCDCSQHGGRMCRTTAVQSFKLQVTS